MRYPEDQLILSASHGQRIRCGGGETPQPVLYNGANCMTRESDSNPRSHLVLSQSPAMSALASVVTVGVGVASHLAYFKHGEHHHAVFRYIQAVIAVYVLTALTRTRLEGVSLGLALASTTTFVVLYFTGLFTSLLVWRIFFNPLNKIPGPFRARITKFHSSFLQGKLDRHHWLKQYHEKYGKFVRIGPNDISVIDTRGISVISSSQSKCYKSPWYESGDPSLRSLQTTRDRADHERRRRVWVPAFSDKALREYEVRIQQYNDLLLDQIEARIGSYRSLPYHAKPLPTYSRPAHGYVFVV